MRAAARVQAAIELLDEIDRTGYPADRTMSHYFRQRRYIGAGDKREISEHLYAVLRHRLSLQYLLKSVSLTSSSRLLIAVHLLQNGTELESVFDGQRHNPTRFGDTQLEALGNIEFAKLGDAPLYVRLNVPEWIAPGLEAVLGQRFADEMQALNERASTDIRVNSLKSSREQLGPEFERQGLKFSNGELAPSAIVFEQRVALFDTDAFKRGEFEVQDQGSQLLALATGVRPGDKVIDFCAGAGGKTLAMAAMMQNRGTLYACDIHSKRLDELKKRCRRAGVHNVRVHRLSSEQDKWIKQHASFADVVLVDAPCTGTGTWRRNPDSRWRLSSGDLQNLLQLQHSILTNAARLVKPGGKLFYATCSLLQEENELQIDQFLAANEGFKPSVIGNLNLFHAIADKVELSANTLRTYPALSGCDGFYLCALQRAEES